MQDLARAWHTLMSRHSSSTPIDDVTTYQDDGGTLRQFSITTPFGDTTFRFRQRDGFGPLFPGAEALPAAATNRFGFGHIDHVTSNFQTMKPMLLWLEHVLGFLRFRMV